jgi:hypothetical protein
MNQILEEIKKAFPNKEDEINEYDKLSKEQGLKKAIEQLEKSKLGMKTTTSTFVYSVYALDMVIAKTLIAFYTYLISSKKPIPPLVIDANLTDKEKKLLLSLWEDEILKKT